ncbi:MAG TPA: P-II family nitrogen regulator [Bacteroidota bacterium]|nr:P-II family nitrogen regulator [Bacteroidota bacterium]
MKEIKAYVRPSLAHRVIEALKQAGATNLSIAHVKGIGLFEDPQTEEYDLEFIEKSSDVLKLEIICSSSDAERYVEVIGKHAQTGKSGDGAIFVTTVERSLKIKTGEEGIA